MPARARRGLMFALGAVLVAVGAPARALALEQTGALSADGRYRAYASPHWEGPWFGIKRDDRLEARFDYVSLGLDRHWTRSDQPDTDYAGQRIAFTSPEPLVREDSNGANDVYVRDMQCATAERVSIGRNEAPANSHSSLPALSGDGRFVAFVSSAWNLVAGDHNGSADVFVADRLTGATERVSVTADGREAAYGVVAFPGPPAISADGRYVAFVTRGRLSADDPDESGLDLYVRDRRAGSIERVSVTSDGRSGDEPAQPSISADGRFVAFEWSAPGAGGTTEGRGVWVRDRATQRTERISTWPSGPGYGADPSISADGSRVAFVGDPDPDWPRDGDGVADIWVRDRARSTTTSTRASSSDGRQNRVPDLSADGRWVSYGEAAGDGGVYDLGAGSERPVPAVQPVDVACPPEPPSSIYRSAVLFDDPAGYWRLGEAPGAAVAFDETRTNDGAYFAPARALGSAGALAKDPDSSIDLNGLAEPNGGESVRIARDYGFAGRAPFTLEAWVKPRNLNGHTRRIFSGESATAGTNADSGYLLGVRSSGLYFSRYRDGRWSTAHTPVTPGVWSHVVASYNGDFMQLFVNGGLRASVPSTIELPARPAGLVIGAKQGLWKFFAGGIDEAAVYRRALSYERVYEHYRVGRLGSPGA